MFYRNTNKQEPLKQIAKQERRRTRIRRLRESGTTNDNKPSGDLLLEAHHCLSSHPGVAINLAHYLEQHRGDPAVLVSYVCVRQF